MSDIMRPMPFGHLMDWALEEYRKSGSFFGVSDPVKHTNGQALPIFDEKIEAPFGPAAGPNTQLAQNIIAAYAAGARFFELKTVQKMDGPELAACINKPCITAGDECYNCEWSTELYVTEAFATSKPGWPANCWRKNTAWAIRTHLCSTCRSAMTWRGSKAKKSTRSSTA